MITAIVQVTSAQAPGDAAENLALYRPVTVSSVGHFPNGTEFAADGQADTGWRSERTAAQGTDWLSVDLEAVCEIDHIRLVWGSRADRPVFEEARTSALFGGEQVASYGIVYSVLLSADGKDWKTVYATTQGRGGQEHLNIQPATARFVKIAIEKRSHVDCGVQINEVIVTGRCQAVRPEAVGWPVRRKAKVKPVLAAADPKARVLSLDSGWELRRQEGSDLAAQRVTDADLDTGDWYNATVPGTILTTLVDQGVFAEPTIGTNNLTIPESLCRSVWWYRTELDLPAEWTQDDQRLWLEFDGINKSAEVWLNGSPVGTVCGAFTRGRFDITKALNKTGTNILAVRILPPAHPGIPMEKNDRDWLYNGGALGKDSPTFVASIGWDWISGVRDRAMGIWQDVRIRRTQAVIMEDPQVVTDLPLPDTSQALVTIKVPVFNAADRAQKARVTAQFEGVSVSQEVTVPSKGSAEAVFDPDRYPALRLKDPKLWWPSGYGPQHLYNLSASVETGGQVSDTKSLQFGVRELSYSGMWRDGKPVDDSQKVLEVSVNGQRILCRGGNWGYPEMLLRLSRERLETAVRLHKEANFTMIRNWVGMSTCPMFYALCDKYGILVWNDFWLANPSDGPDPDDPDLFLQNVQDVVRRYRNHPSIAVWCGRNEGMPPEVLDAGMRRLTETLDGTRCYQSHSADLGVTGNGPYKYVPPAGYFGRLTQGFKTELGMPSVPNADSLRRMLDDPNPWPIDERWAYHDFAPYGNQYREEYIKAIDTKFGPAADLDDFCRKAQMISYDGYRAMFEGCNHKLWNDCSGLLLWMSHPAWPSMVWQTYDYWFNTDGAFFGAKKANEPTHVQFSPVDRYVELINHTSAPIEGNVSAQVVAPDASVLYLKDALVIAQANSRTGAFTIDESRLPPVCFIVLKWSDAKGRPLSENFYWFAREDSALRALNSMPAVKVGASASARSNDGATIVNVRVTNDSDAIALMTQLTLRSARTGERVLPAFFSDNFLSLMPGQGKDIRIECAEQGKQEPLAVEIAGWNAQRQTIAVTME